jgi:hypothetical protein
MSSSAFAFDDSGERLAPEQVLAEQAAEGDGLLQNVLQQTLAAMDVGLVVDDAERQVLREVAERHPGSVLCLEPIVVELVAAILAARFRCLDYPAGVWKSMAPQIARILWEDPASRARLLALWTQLNEDDG